MQPSDVSEDEGESRASPVGVSLALLTLIALLLCGVTSALLRLQSMPREAVVPASAPVVSSSPETSVTSPDDARFRVLTLTDLVLGVMRLDAESDPALRLTDDQRACLLSVEPELRVALQAGERPSDELGARVRQCLTQEQRERLLEAFTRSPLGPPKDAAALAVRFTGFLQNAPGASPTPR